MSSENRRIARHTLEREVPPLNNQVSSEWRLEQDSEGGHYPGVLLQEVGSLAGVLRSDFEGFASLIPSQGLVRSISHGQGVGPGVRPSTRA